MRIAFISFEYPPSVAIGGIGTYAWEASRMLAAAGFDVEVISAGEPCNEPASAHGVSVHRIPASCRTVFRELALPLFAELHKVKPFDLIESPEIGAEGSLIASSFPEVAVVSKLHTPSYLLAEICHSHPRLLDRLRFRLGALRRGRWQGLARHTYNRDDDPEWQFTHKADGIDAPSQAIADRLRSDWDLSADRLAVYPLPFQPDPAFLSLPLPTEPRTIGFLGRLEARKGVVEFARAIPEILKQAPQLRFRFLGPSWPYLKTDMESWIRQQCRAYLDRITFVGAVKREHLVDQLGQCDIVALPSLWENFPFACWESMAAGRAVIGSSSGGMAEVIQPGVSGLLVPPFSPSAIASAVLSLVANPERVAVLGAAGRNRVLEHLSPERILPLQVASYKRAIDRARQLR